MFNERIIFKEYNSCKITNFLALLVQSRKKCLRHILYQKFRFTIKLAVHLDKLRSIDKLYLNGATG